MSLVLERSRKRGRNDEVTVVAEGGLYSSSMDADVDSEEDEERSSSLFAPIMLLAGHEAPIYSVKFSPGGEHLASAGAERKIFLWEVYGEECANFNVLSGHKNAIVELRWCDARTLATASADKTVCLWDAHAGKRKRKWTGHRSFVNAVAAARHEPSVASGSDDGSVALWDERARDMAFSLKHGRAVTAVEFSDDASVVFSGGVDDAIRAWDLRNFERGPLYALDEGHHHTITGLALSPDGAKLLSNAMDSKLIKWDVQSFAAHGDAARQEAVFTGAQHDFQKNLLTCAWFRDASKVSAGSSDAIVHIWDVESTEELYYLPGHRGSVNDVHFHPKEPIVASGASDNLIYLGEIAD